MRWGQTLAIYRETLWADHPFTLVCNNNRAIYLRGVGRPDEALAVGERTLERLHLTRLGVEHPHIGYTRQWQRINRDLEPQPV